MKVLAGLLSLLGACGMLAAEPPRSVDPRVTIELFAESPQIRTPTGIDVDHLGRVWAIENNTHFRPDDYDGHPSDRILIMTDENVDGRCQTIKLFADGFEHAMSIAVRPAWMDPVVLDDSSLRPASKARSDQSAEPTQVFLATRQTIWLLEDTTGDDVCDRRTRLASLSTEGNYPHNGLAGFAFDALGWMYFGFGENLGATYEFKSREGKAEEARERTASVLPSSFSIHPLKGGGEGGNLYRMRPDGTQLSRWATGFWNPHASCVDAFGRLFTVDNDPDSRPPCRLLHIIEGGDYGYRFRNGRKGLHPFTSWNGEIPGTLPMVAGTGEAPSGILAYEHDALPEEYRGRLFVTSWGDHRIDTFELKPRGASFESVAEPLITGGENFRPVGIALAPDGSLYCTDWVLRDYKLHGQGRIWRIRPASGGRQPPEDAAGEATTETRRHGETDDLSSSQFVKRRLAAKEMTLNSEGRERLVSLVLDREQPIRARIEALWAIASVPINVQAIRLLENRKHLAAIFEQFDEVSEAAALLTDTPQISFLKDERNVEPPPKLKMGLDASDPAHPERQLMAAVRMTAAALRMKTVGANLAAVSYLIAMDSSDAFVAAAAIEGLSRLPAFGDFRELTGDRSDREVAHWSVLRRRLRPKDAEFLRDVLEFPGPLARRIAVQWAAEEGMTELRPQVEGVLHSEPMTPELFLATLAALEMLDGKDPKEFDQTPAGKYVLPMLKQESTSAAVKAQALRLVDPADPELTGELLVSLSRAEDEQLRLEAVRTLAAAPRPESADRLINIVSEVADTNDEHALTLFAESVMGLARLLEHPETSDAAKQALLGALIDPEQEDLLRAVRVDLAMAAAIVRSLRNVTGDPAVAEAIEQYARSTQRFGVGLGGGGPRGPSEIRQQTHLAFGRERLPESLKPLALPPPQTHAEWRERLVEEQNEDDDALGGAAARGRTVFYHPNGPGCAKCHTVHGRGGNIGPDLSRIGAAFTREKLIDSILEPSKEISPQYTSWQMVDRDGRVRTGMIVHEDRGVTILGHADGTTTELKTVDIEQRTPQSISVMPEKLDQRMTIQEFRDLLAWLESLK